MRLLADMGVSLRVTEWLRQTIGIKGVSANGARGALAIAPFFRAQDAYAPSQ